MPPSTVTVSTRAYTRLALHSARYPLDSVMGLLLGDASGRVRDALPVSHAVLPLSMVPEIALQQVCVVLLLSISMLVRAQRERWQAYAAGDLRSRTSGSLDRAYDPEKLGTIPGSRDVVLTGPANAATIYAERTGVRVVGVYFAAAGGGPKDDLAEAVAAGAAAVAAKVDELLGGGAVLLLVDNDSLGKKELALKAFVLAGKSWKQLDSSSLVAESAGANARLLRLVNAGAYTGVHDLENHLDDPRVSWLACPPELLDEE
ncbi:hypothetical protein HK405_013720 [Cladochytrium tenue]|nr:hypothetical protein HK405_013720 [Cladochytrium tenue]